MEKFDWHEKEVGISLGVVGAMFALVQGLLIRKIIPALGQEKSVYLGLLLYALGMLLFAFSTEGWMMYGFTVVYCLGAIAGPAIQGIMSNQVPQNEQGELQGGLTSLMSITTIVGPLLMTGLFSYFTGAYAPFRFPGAPFVAGAVMMLASTWLAYRTLRGSKEKVITGI